MRFFVPFLLLFSAQSFAVTTLMQSCPGGASEHTAADVCGSTGNLDCCPPVLSACTAGPISSTEIDGSCSTTVSDGTAYICTHTGATPPSTFVADPTDSTGCTGHDSATPSGGVFSFGAVAGHSASTAYYVTFNQTYDNRVAASEDTQGSVTTTAGGGAGGTDLTGTVYIVDSSASPGGDGLTVATAWDALADIPALATGADVCLMDDSVFEDQTFVVDWGGTSSDRAVIQTCYVDTGDSNKLVAYTDGTGTGRGAKAEINGNYPPSCSDNSTCAINGGDDTPTSIYAGLVSITGTSYITLDSLSIRDSAGRGLNIDTSPSVERSNLIIQNLDIDHSANQGIVAERVVDSVFRNLTVTRSAMCDGYAEAACAGGVDDGNVRPWSGGVVLLDGAERNLVEGLTINRTYGESLACLRAGNNIFRGNTIGHGARVSIYLDNCDETVVENNIVYPDAGNLLSPLPSGMGYQQLGVSVSVEDYGGGYARSSVNNVVRNNMFVGVACAQTYTDPSAFAGGKLVGYEYLHNTCIGTPSGRAVIIFNDNNVDSINFENNIFYAPAVSAADICVQNKPNVTFAANLWSVNPSDADCDGVGDVIGNPSTATAYTALDDQNYLDPPVIADFEASGAGVGGANNLASTPLLLESNYGSAVDAFANCDPASDADWQYAGALDANCDAHSGDMGALANP